MSHKINDFHLLSVSVKLLNNLAGIFISFYKYLLIQKIFHKLTLINKPQSTMLL